jgi:Xaa-Pro aminopeptidase
MRGPEAASRRCRAAGRYALPRRGAQRQSVRHPEIAARNADPLLVAMREVKSASELALSRKAIDTTAAAHKAAMKRILIVASQARSKRRLAAAL